MSLNDDKYRLFVMCKNEIPIYDSEGFTKWFHDNYDGEMHHLLASFSHRKTTNLLSFPLKNKDHEEAQADKINFAFNNFPKTLAILICYVKFLEQQLN